LFLKLSTLFCQEQFLVEHFILAPTRTEKGSMWEKSKKGCKRTANHITEFSIMLLVSCSIWDNCKISIPIVFHHQTVVGWRTTISCASVRSYTFIEPSRDQAIGCQEVLQVCGWSNCKINFWHKFFSILAVKSVFKVWKI